MDKPVIDVQPASQHASSPYSRAACLLQIIQTATMQLRQDADGLEQEDMALASRLLSIRANIQQIEQNDKLLRG
jgi:hypothetical protein